MARKPLGHSISYLAKDDAGPFAGHLLEGGRPTVLKGIPSVVFDSHPDVPGRKAILRYDTRPDLALLVEQHRLNSDPSRQGDPIAPSVLEDVVPPPPSGHVLVEIELAGLVGASPVWRYRAEGIQLSWRDVNLLGTRSVSLGPKLPVVSMPVASVPKEVLRRLRASMLDAAKEDTDQARMERLFTSLVPEEARLAWQKYKTEDEARRQGNQRAGELLARWGTLCDTYSPRA